MEIIQLSQLDYLGLSGFGFTVAWKENSFTFTLKVWMPFKSDFLLSIKDLFRLLL